jgi:hypothetical protein
MDVRDSPRIHLRNHPLVETAPKLSHQLLKKRITKIGDDSRHYETVRKKVHNNEENDSTFFA